MNVDKYIMTTHQYFGIYSHSLTCVVIYIKIAQWIVITIGARDSRIKELEATVDKQSKDIAKLNQQIRDFENHKTMESGSHTRSQSYEHIIFDRV